MRNLLLTVWLFLLDLFFPKFCCGCGTLDTYLCPRCFNSIALVSTPLTLKLETLYIDQIQAVCYYEDVVKQLIRTYKYDGIRELSTTLARFIFYTTTLPPVDIITAVPLHKKRLEERGFNQSEKLAEELAHLLRIPYKQFLQRTVFLQPQAEIRNEEARKKNTAGNFSLLDTAEKDQLENKIILIVDDVCTTGSTLNECARILKKNGAQKVLGLSVAHGM